MKKLIVKGLATATTFAALSTAAFAECGDVQMAEMNWASAELMANVDKFILENGYGCNVELVAGATMTTANLMWLPNFGSTRCVSHCLQLWMKGVCTRPLPDQLRSWVKAGG